MKFTKGVWLMREGVTPHYALHVYDYEYGTHVNPLCSCWGMGE